MTTTNVDTAEPAKKRLATLRLLLLGRKYYFALRAMEFAMRFHTGMRKDGVTPEFDHQVTIALYILTLADLIDPQGTIIAALLHDTPEDYPVLDHDILPVVFPRKEDREYGHEVCASIDLLNKYERDRTPKDEDVLYAAMAEDCRASIVKPADRSSNFSTMLGVFTYAKQAEYIAFAETRIIPMMKAARRHFPEQNAAYENMKRMLREQINLLRAVHAVAIEPRPAEAKNDPGDPRRVE